MPRLSSLTNQAIIRIIFWAHFIVATTSHFTTVLLLGGAINLFFSGEPLGFWTRGMMFGLLFMSGMYGVNHVTNPAGFCVLTDLENFYRRKEDMPEVGPYMPRYYKVIRIWFNKIKRST